MVIVLSVFRSSEKDENIKSVKLIKIFGACFVFVIGRFHSWLNMWNLRFGG